MDIGGGRSEEDGRALHIGRLTPASGGYATEQGRATRSMGTQGGRQLRRHVAAHRRIDIDAVARSLIGNRSRDASEAAGHLQQVHPASTNQIEVQGLELDTAPCGTGTQGSASPWIT